jgi:signal transduction histidine kinase
MMLLKALNHRDATAARLIGLALVTWTVIGSKESPALHGRGLVVLVALVLLVGAWLVWTAWSCLQQQMTPDLYVLAASSGLLAAAAPSAAGSAGAFVIALSAAARVDLRHGFAVVCVAVVAMGAGLIAYHGSGVGLLAYAAAWSAMAFAGANIRNTDIRAEQAELLLAQTQRSHEEQLRSARLEEQTRIAREIHDVLAHSLAGLTIQLEATTALLDQGADPQSIRERVDRAHQLAREGLRETRRAVGALRGDQSASVAMMIKVMVDDYRSEVEAPVELALTGEQQLLDGPAGEAVLRVVQEALTNVRKHAPGAQVTVSVDAGLDRIQALVADRQAAPVVAGVRGALHSSGGGYGVRGMRERAQLLGGTLQAGPTDDGWRVELRLPLEARG